MLIKTTVQSFLFLVIIAGMLGGCTPSAPAIDTTQLFQGYPCQNNCRDFAAGFESARNQQFTREVQCDTVSESLKLGCRTYIHEYRLEHEQPNGYVFPDK